MSWKYRGAQDDISPRAEVQAAITGELVLRVCIGARLCFGLLDFNAALEFVCILSISLACQNSIVRLVHLACISNSSREL